MTIWLLVFPESDALYLTLEVQLSNALHQGVVPKHDLIWGVLGTLSSAHQRNDVSPVKHLYNPDSSIELYIRIHWVN